MRKFFSELRGKTVMTNEGDILGFIDNFVMDTSTGNIHHVLVMPHNEVDARLFQTDTEGRLILPFKSMRAVRDVVVMELAGR
jgi:sporulation protein YlmC with PRC-barrel domain